MDLFERDSHSKSLSTAEFEELLKSFEGLESKLEFEGHFTRDEKIVAFREMEEFVFGEGIGKSDSRKAFRVSYRLFFRLFRNYISMWNIPPQGKKLSVFKTKSSFIWKAEIRCDSQEITEYGNAILKLNNFSFDEIRKLSIEIMNNGFPRNGINEFVPISRLSNQPYLFYSEKINDEEYTLHLFIKYSLAKSL
jgi:hypothetical protein